MSMLNGVSIIICCFNSARRLPETLAHLQQQIVPDHLHWEVIVVDNGSTDRTGEVSIDLWGNAPVSPLRVVVEPKLGLSNARRCGFHEAKYEFVSFVDDDNWVSPNWLETVYQVMTANPYVGACGGGSEAVFEVKPPGWFEKYQGWFAVGAQAQESGDITWGRGWLWGAGLTIRKMAWNFLLENGFQPILSGREGKRRTTGEDVELCLAMRLAGWHLWYEKSLVLKHFMPAGRLRWDYLRNLMRGNGASTFGLIPYKLALIEDLKAPLGRSGKIWTWKLRSAISNLIKLRKKWLQSQLQLLEGDYEVLEVEKLIGNIVEILRKRDNFDRNIINIRNAKWNLIGSKQKIENL